MSQKLINLNPDLKKLQQEGYEVIIFQDIFLIVNNIPYVNCDKNILYGDLISKLDLAGNQTISPKSHVVFFSGDEPCDHQGKTLDIQCGGELPKLQGKYVKYAFSHKPRSEGYKDYFEKMDTYVKILSNEAASIDHTVTAKNFNIAYSQNNDSVFCYPDTNSARGHIHQISEKLQNQRIAIIGLGGTGAYVLDLISKTHVSEIHLFDADNFVNHNAFRCPGAASIKDLEENPKKTNYLKKVYSKMHKHIFSHSYDIEPSNFTKLLNMNFVFICIDKGSVKKPLFDFLIKKQISFIDVGIGIIKENEKLLGQVRMNLCTPDQISQLEKYISFSEGQNDEYSTNIQIADLNSINATLAVIKWKKLFGFYEDFTKEHTNIYTIRSNSLVSVNNMKKQ